VRRNHPAPRMLRLSMKAQSSKSNARRPPASIKAPKAQPLRKRLAKLEVEQQELRRTQIEFQTIYERAPIMMCLVNDRHEIERINQTMAAMLWPLSKDPVVARGRSSLAEIPNVLRLGDISGCLNAPQTSDGCGFGPGCGKCSLRTAVGATLSTGQPCQQLDCVLRLKQKGGWRKLDVCVSTARIESEGRAYVLVCLEDISNRKRLEAQLFQAQKMEAIGQLAGFVAHDFSHLLSTTLTGLARLNCIDGLEGEAMLVVDELQTKVERAAGLVQKLLLFGRRQPMQLKHLDLNAVVAEQVRLLRRLLGAQIDLDWTEGGSPLWLDGDPSMLEQVIVSLCLNARDAMPLGGPLVIRCEAIDITPSEALEHPDRRAGTFVCLIVADTGAGMEEEMVEHIFEPFFTTRDLDGGAGLGLAALYGIVKLHQGWTEVESAVGQGTRVSVFLPRAEPEAKPTPPMELLGDAGGKRETILVVEDDNDLRELITLNLDRFGYRVLQASNGPEAIKTWELHNGAIDLLLTDMVMPEGMTGWDVINHLRRWKPTLKIVISSGYPLESDELDHPANKSVRLLTKPYPPLSLARLVRQCLDEKPDPV